MVSIDDLQKGLRTAYIDGSVVSDRDYRPEFVINDYQAGKKVLAAVEDELRQCDSFRISVAFITKGGVVALLQTLKELESKKIPGEILTTNFQHFTEPQALEQLHSLSNITVRMYDVESAGVGFHTKGYIFKKEEIYRIIIGSSNITKDALNTNHEWNTKIVSLNQGEIATQVLREFESLWNSEFTFPLERILDRYKEEYEIIKHQRQIAQQDQIVSLEKYRLEPNSMQVGFIENLKKILAAGNSRALLISATGTGKTYASAFAMRELGYKKVLFLVHRGQLAVQTKKSYERILPGNMSLGLVGAGHSDYEADYIFATVQTVSRDNHLLTFDPHAFDCIILDEAHHVPANTYQKIMNHFEPKLWLGMTATPDKQDDNIAGRNVYELFNHQIAYEIRLQKAMEDDLLCPFNYFGIADLDLIDDSTATSLTERDFQYLTSDERVKHIVAQARYYGYSGDRVKGLVFCSRIAESEELSRKFNQFINLETGKKYRTIALNGSATEEERQAAFERLAVDENDPRVASGEIAPLDYIFSVEILNEGVDIVEVNQVIMLRPTESPIVFIQQLGRGLRKAEGKEYVVVLDFIGNYNNNFMIPIALSGDRTYNKDNIRRYVMEGGRIIPGASTVHFDSISRTRIYDSINRMSTQLNMLKGKYYDLKNRLGRIPTIIDFYEMGDIDPLLFIEYSKSYDRFVRRIDKDYKVSFTDVEEQILEYVSNVIVNGKRIHELLLIRLLIDLDGFDVDDYSNTLKKTGETYRKEDLISALRVLTKDFIKSADQNKYQLVELIDKDAIKTQQVSRTKAFANLLTKNDFKKEIQLLIQFGLQRYNDLYKKHDDNNLVLYQKYSRADVCRILNWDKDESSTIYGYRIKHGTCPIFVTYEKSDDIAPTTMYQDEFERISTNPDEYSNRVFSWMTRNRVREQSPEAQALIHAKEIGLKVLLFLKKSDGEGTDFYYMGEVIPTSWRQTTIQDKNNNDLPIMNFKLQLIQEARKDIFDYFIA